MALKMQVYRVLKLSCLSLLIAARPAAAGGLEELMDPGSAVRKVAGDFKFTEGPAFGPQGFLLFSDIPANEIRRLRPDGSTVVFLERSEGANGLLFDPAGRLLACQGGGRRVVRIEIAAGDKAGKITTLADSFDGKKLNSPNDLALDPEGGVFFTDPRYGQGDAVEQPVMGVYYIDPAGKATRVIEDLKRPNGILVSPDGKRLYVANPDARELYRYSIEAPGKLAGKKLIFTGDRELDGGGPDGMALDERGNVYATYKGIVVLDPDGALLGRIPVPEHPANCTFGGPERRTLYITARTGLYAVEMKIRGMALLGPKAAAAAAAPGSGDLRETKAGSVTLRVPRSWKEIGPDGRMRLNQFEVAPSAGGGEPAELIVYYFGPGGAGGVAANLERWVGQFSEEGRKVKLTRGKSAAGEYTLADVTGTYQKPIGPPVERKTKAAPGSRMLAAILNTGEGPHFLKFTGPEATVSAAAEAFRASFGARAAEETEYRPEEK